MKNINDNEKISSINDIKETEFDFSLGYTKGKGWNYQKTDGTFLYNGDEWFDELYGFVNGVAMVRIDGEGWNFLKKCDGTLLWNGEKWFDECFDFQNGFARVKYNGEWCYLTQNGDLISTKQYFQQIEQRLANGENPKNIFNEVGDFENEFAIVRLNGIGWNFLKHDGTLLWPEDTWFDECDNFKNGFAKVGYKGEWCYLTQNGDLISKEQYIQQIEQRLANGENPKNIFNEVGDFENEFAIVRLNGIGWNFLKHDGTLLWPGDTWFDECDNFKNGFAKVGYKGEWCYLTQSGNLISMKRYIKQIEQRLANGENPKKIFNYVGVFVNGFAIARLVGKGYNYLKTNGTLLQHDEWFDDAWNFKNGFAAIYIQDKGFNYLKSDGTFLWNDDTWLDLCDDFNDGFARIEIDGIGWNFLKPDGTLLWNGEKWFDVCSNFYNGFAIVKIEEKGTFRLFKDGALTPIEE